MPVKDVIERFERTRRLDGATDEGFLLFVFPDTIVATPVAGIYGMNFENMPELKWQRVSDGPRHHGAAGDGALPDLQEEGLAVEPPDAPAGTSSHSPVSSSSTSRNPPSSASRAWPSSGPLAMRASPASSRTRPRGR